MERQEKDGGLEDRMEEGAQCNTLDDLKSLDLSLGACLHRLEDKQENFGEIGVIEDGLDHELEEVTFIPGTQVPNEVTSSVEEISEDRPEPEDLGLEAEDEHATMIAGTGVPGGGDIPDVVLGTNSPAAEIGVRIPEIEARWRESTTVLLPVSPEPARHKISWGEGTREAPERLQRMHTWHGDPDLPRQGQPAIGQYSWDLWPGPCPEVPRYIGSMDLPMAPEAEVPGGGPDADIALPDAGEQGEDRTMPTANGGLAKKRPESVASSKGDPEDISDLKRQFSHTSLVSIFSHSVREKLSNVLPSGLPKNSDLNKLRILVCILFAVCFGIVFATHVFHRRHKGEVRIFDQVRLEEHHRHLLLYDTDNRLVTQGHLGRLMPEALHPYPCKPEHTSSKEVKCLEWKYLARLEISPVAQAGASCHRLVWSSLSRDVTPRDCWPVGPGEGHWYGGGERMENTTWPLGSTATVTMSPFVTGDEAKTEWGNVIKKSWLNSRGLSITVDDETPLSISLNDPKVTHGHHGLCLQASFDEFPYYYHRVNLPVLNYTVCTAQDLGKVYSSHLTPSWEGQSDTDIQMLNRLLRLPLWQVPSLGAGETYSPAILDSYLSSLLGRNRAGRGERGYILLDSHWQQQMGDFTFAPSFTNSRKAQDLVRETGLRLAITISPFVSVDSASFREGVMQGLFVMERNSTSPRGTPALTWFQDVPVAALLDITNNKTISWLRNKLRSLAQGEASEAVFFLDTGNTFHMPHYFSFNRTLSSPDLYKQHFIREAMEEVPVIGVSGASSARPKAPAFVSLSPLPPTWPSLQSIVPNILHLGVIGFPFINPGPIGGVPTNTSSLPEAELYKRWWQLATFLPQLHFLTPPKAYLEQGIATVSRSLKQIREKLVTPLLLNISREAVISGLPLVRPLWMLAPHDEVSQRISDQFLLGDTLLVAPVLREGQRARDVYLPPTQQGAGVWKSKDDTYHAGGQWLNNTEAPLDSVLYYQRLPEGSRPGDTLG